MPQTILNRPRLHVGEAEANRKATWLELFYDLVYVATVIEIGNRLSGDVSINGFLGVVALFVPVWWSWVGTTFYSNRFDSDDALHRILVFTKIFFVSLMAIHVFDALGETAPQFALGYAGVRFTLVVMYLRARYHIKAARALATRYAVGFTLTALAWLVSVIVPPPARYILWVLGLVVDFATPLSPRSRALQEELPPSPYHLPERFGLFTIIVLGEAFIKVIGGLSGRPQPAAAFLQDAPGLIIAVSLWWLYFDNVAESKVQWKGRKAQIWLYTHLPLQLGLTMFGVGIYKLVTLEAGTQVPGSYRWLICGSVAVALLAIGVVELVTAEGGITPRWKSEFYLRVISASLIMLLAIWGDSIETTLLMVLIAAIAALQVAVDLYWRSKLEPNAELPQL